MHRCTTRKGTPNKGSLFAYAPGMGIRALGAPDAEGVARAQTTTNGRTIPLLREVSPPGHTAALFQSAAVYCSGNGISSPREMANPPVRPIAQRWHEVCSHFFAFRKKVVRGEVYSSLSLIARDRICPQRQQALSIGQIECRTAKAWFCSRQLFLKRNTRQSDRRFNYTCARRLCLRPRPLFAHTCAYGGKSEFARAIS